MCIRDRYYIGRRINIQRRRFNGKNQWENFRKWKISNVFDARSQTTKAPRKIRGISHRQNRKYKRITRFWICFYYLPVVFEFSDRWHHSGHRNLKGVPPCWISAFITPLSAITIIYQFHWTWGRGRGTYLQGTPAFKCKRKCLSLLCLRSNKNHSFNLELVAV